MIAGDHFDPDACVAAFGNGGDRFTTRRIDQADEPDEHQLAIDVLSCPGCDDLGGTDRTASASTR